MNTTTHTALTPWHVLGLAENAGPEAIRAAYLAKVKEFPPDRAPEQFEQVREAYDLLKDPLRRFRSAVLEANAMADLTELFPAQPPERRFVGPAPWLAAIKSKTTS